MKTISNSRIALMAVAIAGMSMLFGSCVTVRKGPRPPRHHHRHPPRHPHRAEINIKQVATPWQGEGSAVMEDCLAMLEPNYYDGNAN